VQARDERGIGDRLVIRFVTHQGTAASLHSDGSAATGDVNTPALPPPPPPPGIFVSGAKSKLVNGRSAPGAPSSCERSSSVIPAGLAATVEASAAIAARPALAVPRSGAPVSYSNRPAPRAEVTNVSRVAVAAKIVQPTLRKGVVPRAPATLDFFLAVSRGLSLQFQETIRYALCPIVHRVLRVAPLERSRTLQPHAACTLVNCFGQHGTGN